MLWGRKPLTGSMLVLIFLCIWRNCAITISWCHNEQYLPLTEKKSHIPENKAKQNWATSCFLHGQYHTPRDTPSRITPITSHQITRRYLGSALCIASDDDRQWSANSARCGRPKVTWYSVLLMSVDTNQFISVFGVIGASICAMKSSEWQHWTSIFSVCRI